MGFHTRPRSPVGRSAPAFPAEQFTFPQRLVFASQWLRLFPPWSLGCVDILWNRVEQARIFFMLSITAKGRMYYAQNPFITTGVILLKS